MSPKKNVSKRTFLHTAQSFFLFEFQTPISNSLYRSHLTHGNILGLAVTNFGCALAKQEGNHP